MEDSVSITSSDYNDLMKELDIILTNNPENDEYLPADIYNIYINYFSNLFPKLTNQNKKSIMNLYYDYNVENISYRDKVRLIGKILYSIFILDPK